VDVAVFAISVVAGAILPIFPVLFVGAIAMVDGILPGLLSNARHAGEKGVEAGLRDLGLPSPEDKRTLPGASTAYWNGKIHHVAVTAEGIDTAIDASTNLVNPLDWVSYLIDPRFLSGARSPADRAAYRWQFDYGWPMAFSVKLSRALERLGASASVVWQVYRTDTNALLATVSRPYFPGPRAGGEIFRLVDSVVRGTQGDPATNGILIGLRHKDYYFMEGVRVTCRVTASLGAQVGEIFSAESVVLIEDNLDRHRKFVEWGPHLVFFQNAGTGGHTWSHNRTSRIHRTALGGRCRMMRQRASEIGRKRPKFRYMDTLRYKWEELHKHRHYLCEYCFFGGPDKIKPFPEEDWF
jgi:hypothetical protein